MIPADELQQGLIERQDVVIDTLVLADDEQAAYDFIDADLDRDVPKLVGNVFLKAIPGGMATEKVVAVLKKNWEAGGWIVEAFRTEDGGWLIAFVRPRTNIISAKAVTEALDARDVKRPQFLTADQIKAFGARSLRDPKTACPLLVRMPTRGRPNQAIEVLTRYRKMAVRPVKMEVVIDEDDESMHRADVLQRLCDLDCVITVGRHRSKIHAVNGGRVDDWEILVLASDDMWPVVEGWDLRVMQEMDRHFPLRDGALNFNDGYNKDHVREGKPVLCTLPVMGRHLWEQFGYVYHPEYKSLYCDDEYTELLTSMNRLAFVDDIIIEHRHHASGKATNDALYQHNDKLGPRDRGVYEERAARNFDAPPCVLSLLICSTMERRHMLDRLVNYLRAEIRGIMMPRWVEILVDIDAGAVSIGEKRQRLLERARGKYVAFIDDDDWVACDYVRRVLSALATEPDCASLVGVMTTNGENPERFEHALKYETWTKVGDVHVRCPNHLNAVRRELALKVGFVAKSFGEDADYSMRLRPLLKTEGSTGDAPLYFYWYRSKK